MPPKSRGASGKGNAMTAEMKKQMQEEMIQQRQQKRKQYIQELLQREAEATLSNRQKVGTIMAEKLRGNKVAELRTQLDQLQRDFERALERKDAAVMLLSKYVTIAEQQRKNALTSHAQTVGTLRQMLEERAEAFTAKAEDDIARLKAQFDQERDALERAYKLRKDTLQEIKQATINDEEELIQQLKHDYDAQISQAQSNAKEQLNIMQMRLQEQNTELEQLLLQEHERYKENTDAKQHNYKYLLVQDQKSSNIIEENKIRIQQLERQINHWKSKIQQTSEEFRQKNELLRQEKDEAQKEYSALKSKLLHFRATERQRQKQLVADAHDAEDKITGLKETAERIVRLSVLCGRLETEAERVNEVPRLSQQQKKEVELEVQRRIQEAGIGADGEKSGSEAQQGVVKGIEELDHVYHKLSQATVDRLALLREQNNLERENRELREALQRCLSVGTVSGV